MPSNPHRIRSFHHPVGLTALIALAAILSSAALCPASPSQVRVVQQAEGFQFCDAKEPVLFYCTAPKATAAGTYSRTNYCHPVYGLDGTVITEDFPADHLHHRGIFWAWHQVYVGDTPMGDMWACQDFAWDIHTVRILEPEESSAALQARVYWKSSQWKQAAAPFAEETVTIRVHQAAHETRLIDFDIEIRALEPGLRLGGSNDVKGYGGFSTRIVLPPDIRMSDPNGPVTPQNTAVPAGYWMNFSATFGDAASSVAILVHPAHPGHPRQWILRNARSAQNLAYPGREPVPIPMAQPLTLRYRLVFHRNADLNRLFRAYSQSKDPH